MHWCYFCYAVNRDESGPVAALRSAIEIAGREDLRDWLEQLAHSDSFMVREVAQRSTRVTNRM